MPQARAPIFSPTVIRTPGDDWTQSVEEFPIPGVCLICRRGRPPAHLAAWCERWIVYEGMVGAGTQLALMRFHRGVPGIWHIIDSRQTDGAVSRARLLVMGVFDAAQWGGPQAGVRPSVSSLTINKSTHLLLELKPGAVRALLGVSGQGIANQRPQLSDVWGRDGVELEEHMALAPDSRTRLRVLAAALTRRLGQHRTSVGAELVQGLGWLDHQHRIHDLAAGCGYSQRQLERLFADHVGLAPKRLTGLMRAGDAMQHSLSMTEPNWASIALRFGFADQSHLTRAVSKLFSMPPGRFHALCRTRGCWANAMVFFPDGIG